MKPIKQISLFTLALALFALLACVAALIVDFFPPKDAAAIIPTQYLTALFASVPFFMTLGTAIGAARRGSLSFAFCFFGILAFVFMLAQVPIALIDSLLHVEGIPSFGVILLQQMAIPPIDHVFYPELSTPFGIVLLSYMFYTAVNVVLLLVVFLLAYAIFLSAGRAEEDGRLFGLRDGGARALLFASGAFSLARLGTELLQIVLYIRNEKHGLVHAEDLFDMTLATLFPFLLFFVTYLVGRLAERLFPTALPDAEEDEDDAEDYIS